MNDASVLPLLIGASGITGVVVAILQAAFNRYKLKADATAVLTGAAGGLVTALQADNGRLRAENVLMKARTDRKEKAERKRDETFRAQLRRHHEYDVQLVMRLRELGIDLPDPPPLEFPDYDYEIPDAIGSDGPSSE